MSQEVAPNTKSPLNLANRPKAKPTPAGNVTGAPPLEKVKAERSRPDTSARTLTASQSAKRTKVDSSRPDNAQGCLTAVTEKESRPDQSVVTLSAVDTDDPAEQLTNYDAFVDA